MTEVDFWEDEDPTGYFVYESYLTLTLSPTIPLSQITYFVFSFQGESGDGSWYVTFTDSSSSTPVFDLNNSSWTQVDVLAALQADVNWPTYATKTIASFTVHGGSGNPIYVKDGEIDYTSGPTLTVNCALTSVSFTLDGTEYSTNYSASVSSGIHTIIALQPIVVVNGLDYAFVGSTTITQDIESDTTITFVYQEVPAITIRTKAITILQQSLTGLIDVEWEDLEPWVRKAIPRGPIIKQHLIGPHIEGSFATHDFQSLTYCLMQTHVEYGSTSMFPIDPLTGAKLEFSLDGQQFVIDLENNYGDILRFKFTGVRIKYYELDPLASSGLKEAVYRVYWMADTMVYSKIAAGD